MNRALFQLLALNNKAMFRRSLRGAKTVRGALLLLFTLAFITLMIVPQVMLSGRPELRMSSGTGPPMAAPALLALTLVMVLTAAGEAALYFTPAEVDLLFAGPFARRELVFYKLAKMLIALVVMSAIMSLSMLSTLPSWPRGYLGLFLALAMVQLLGMVTALAGQTVSEATTTRARRLTLAVVAAVVLAGIADVTRRAQGGSLPEIVQHLRESPIFVALLAPFEVFTRAIFAPRWFPDFAGWATAGLAIDVLLLVLVLRLDANYIEAAAAISQRVYERVRRTKQGGGVALAPGAGAARLKVPPLPWLGGAGPLAWRQLLLVMRTSRHLLFVTLMMMVVAGAGFAFSPRAGPAAPPPGTGAGRTLAPSAGPRMAPILGIGMVSYMTFIFAMQLPWAFRGDLDHIDFLKTLPVRPSIVAAGELAGGIVALTVLQVCMLGLMAAALPEDRTPFLIAAAFCLPFNGVLMALNNGLFLLYPIRMQAGTSFDVQMMGRTMLFMGLQVLLLFPLLGLPAAIAGFASYLTGSWTVFAVAAWLGILGEIAPLVLAVAWAFHRFDVSAEIPV